KFRPVDGQYGIGNGGDRSAVVGSTVLAEHASGHGQLVVGAPHPNSPSGCGGVPGEGGISDVNLAVGLARGVSANGAPCGHGGVVGELHAVKGDSTRHGGNGATLPARSVASKR